MQHINGSMNIPNVGTETISPTRKKIRLLLSVEGFKVFLNMRYISTAITNTMKEIFAPKQAPSQNWIMFMNFKGLTQSDFRTIADRSIANGSGFGMLE